MIKVATNESRNLNHFIIRIMLFAIPTCLTIPWAAAQDVTQFVDPFIGTANKANTNPGATLPWGMASIAPYNAHDTVKYYWHPSPYVHGRPYISGFTQANLSGTGCPDLGTINLMPTTGPLTLYQPNNTSAYSEEVATPGYYAVTLDTYGIRTALSATTRSTISQYTFPEGPANIILNLGLGLTRNDGAVIRRIAENEVEGYKTVGNFCGLTSTQNIYFYARINRESLTSGVFDHHRQYPNYTRPLAGKEIGAYFSFEAKAGETVTVQVGISYVSAANARENLEREQPTPDFEKIRKAAKANWNETLSRIQVEGGTTEDKVKFYTALYHALIHPNIFNDVNGEYPAYQTHDIQKIKDKERYSVFSLWDTYRNVHPLLSLVYPERQSAMVQSLISMYDEGGWLPRWELAGMETGCMVGDPSLPVIVDSYLRGVKDFDVHKAYEAMVHNATATLPDQYNIMRPGLEDWLQYGYLPHDIHTQEVFHANYEEMLHRRTVWGSVSTALEYAIADWNLAQMAKALDKEVDYQTFYGRSMLYKNNFDPSQKFMRGKWKDGRWADLDLDHRHTPAFTEGNTWSYTFMVPHDIPGLMKLMGGARPFTQKLNQCFDEGHFDVTNEPDIAYPYLFNYVEGAEWRTQQRVRHLVDTAFHTGPDGIPGNDDCGTLSTWLVYSMMGFYPDCPGKMDYQLTSPVFDKVEITLHPDYYPGEKFTIVARNNAKDHVRIQRVRLNGKPVAKYQISHEAITHGATLIYDLKPLKKP